MIASTRPRWTLLWLALLSTAGCDLEKKAENAEEKAGEDKAADEKTDAAPRDVAEKAKPDETAKSDSEEDKPDADAKAKAKGDDEDKGSARLELGDDGVEWKAQRASAYPKDDGKLKILASVQHTEEGTTHRRALTLTIKDFKGPGTYDINDYSSNLTGVSINFDKVKKAEEAKDKAEADKAATKAATDALGGASVVLLKGAKVEITKVSDDFIDGTLTWAGIISVRGPKKIAGEFHARIKKKD